MRCRWLILAAIAAPALATTAAPALAAATRYAAPASAGLADCSSPVNACRLRLAVNGAADEDRVVVLPGTYWLSSELTPTSDVSVMGQPGSRPVIRMSGAGSLGDFAGTNKPTTVSNLELRSTGSGSAVTIGYRTTLTHVIVQMTTQTSGVAAVTATPGSKVADSVIRASGSGSPFGVQVLAGPPTEPDLSTLVNDTVVATGSGSIAIEVTSAGILIPPPHCGPFVADAALVSVIAHGALGGLGTDAVNPAPVYCAPQSVITTKYSNYNGIHDANGGVTDGGHDQTTPALTNPNTIFRAFPTNLHERPGAPTINAGYSTGLEATDLDGNPRVIGPAADIGAYEFRPATRPPAPRP